MNEHCGIIERSCQEEFREINRKLDLLDEALRGNGMPGLKQRIDRLEEAHASARRLLWCLVGVVVPLMVSAAWKLLLLIGG